jgi:hypothetical protein
MAFQVKKTHEAMLEEYWNTDTGNNSKTQKSLAF